MQIQKICNPILGNNNSTREKSNRPSFSGPVYWLDSGLESLPEFKLFQSQIEKWTIKELNVFIRKMPKDEGDLVKVRVFQKPSIQKLENIKITYHNTLTHYINTSGLYLDLNPNKKPSLVDKNNDKLFDHFLQHASSSIDVGYLERVDARIKQLYSKKKR